MSQTNLFDMGHCDDGLRCMFVLVDSLILIYSIFLYNFYKWGSAVESMALFNQ